MDLITKHKRDGCVCRPKPNLASLRLYYSSDSRINPFCKDE